MTQTPLGHAESLSIGTVEFVSPNEIKVLLDIDAPESVALNAGVPRPFPRVNSYVLISNDEGYLVGQVEWLTIERSAFPKRRGMQDFGLVDLPYPLRKMSINPLGTLRKIRDTEKEDQYRFQRGSNSFPSVGDNVLIPTQKQLRSIVESGENRRVNIGTSPLAGNANVNVDPDRLFGRHLAVLGNTGSGKSCSVAGLIRWSIEAASQKKERPNARFIVLDPNGEYARAFGKESGILKARIIRTEGKDQDESLSVPLWLWNSAEWATFTHASEKTQRPILQQALRLRRNKKDPANYSSSKEDFLVYLKGVFSNIDQQISSNAPFASMKDSSYWGFIEMLNSIKNSFMTFKEKSGEIADKVEPIIECLNDLIDNKSKNDRGFNKPFEYADVDLLKTKIESILQDMGGDFDINIPINEDTPIPFTDKELLADLNFLSTNTGNRQWFEFFMMRIQTMLAETRIKSIISETNGITLDQWLNDYIGSNKARNGCLIIIDLSLVPSEIIHIMTAVIARMIFEALQRYRRLNDKNEVLPTTLVMEEAHTFIKRYKEDAEMHDSASVCCQVFERIAREGRKFGLGLVLSSQRPSELSPTVLSQCNSFLLHRISNDRDQDLVYRFVPDNLKGLFRELPSLPSQNAILLGWASELPVLVRMNDLSKEHQPQSDDPDFWSVWTGVDENGKEVNREVDWKKIAEDWQKITSENMESDSDSPEEDI